MPFQSEAQRGLFYAAKAGKKWATRQVPQATAEKFIADTGHQTGKLPEHVPTSRAQKARKRYPHQARD